MVRTDVFVAGGGPAGLATAIAAARQGMSVVVADAARPPIDKACGEGIMPDGVDALAAMGVELGGLPSARLDGIRFLDAAGEVSARFAHGVGLGVRRTVLHAALIARAESAGVRLAWGSRVAQVRQGEAVLHPSKPNFGLAGESQTIRCRFIICADGLHSALRQMAGLGAGRLTHRRYGVRRHVRVRPWSLFVEVYWAECGQIYITPTGAEEICVALLTSDPHCSMETALRAFPSLQEKLRGCPWSDERRMGAITATRRLAAVTRGRIALVGDASGSADAITGDGLSLAFRQAMALAEAISVGELSRYQQAHERISRLPRTMGALLLLLDAHPRLRSRAFRCFARSPELFDRLLAVHTRGIAPGELGMRDCLQFGWRLLCA